MATRKITEIKDNATGDINQMRDNDIINNVPSTTSSDAAITTSVPLVAEDGSIVKIKRDSFVEAIASVFAANNQTNFSKLFGVNGTTPMGIEPSALASVLGGAYLDFSVGMASYSHYYNDPSYLCDVPSDNRTLIFFFEYVGTRRGIFSVSGALVYNVVPSANITVNQTSTADNTHVLYVNSGKVYFNSEWSGTIRFKAVQIL